MTDPIWTTAIGQLPAFVAAVTAACIGWANHKKGDQIHTLVNSQNETLQKKVDAANARILALEQLLTQLTAKKA